MKLCVWVWLLGTGLGSGLGYSALTRLCLLVTGLVLGKSPEKVSKLVQIA